MKTVLTVNMTKKDNIFESTIDNIVGNWPDNKPKKEDVIFKR